MERWEYLEWMDTVDEIRDLHEIGGVEIATPTYASDFDLTN